MKVEGHGLVERFWLDEHALIRFGYDGRLPIEILRSRSSVRKVRFLRS